MESCAWLASNARHAIRSAGRTSARPSAAPRAALGSAQPTRAVSARRLRNFSPRRDDHTPGSRLVMYPPISSPENESPGCAEAMARVVYSSRHPLTTFEAVSSASATATTSVLASGGAWSMPLRSSSSVTPAAIISSPARRSRLTVAAAAGSSGRLAATKYQSRAASHSAVSGNVTLRVTPCMVRLSGLRLGYLGVKGRVVRSAISLVSLKVVVVFGPAAAFGTDSAFCVQDTSRMTATFPPSDDDLRPRPSEIPVIRSLRSVPDHGPRQ